MEKKSPQKQYDSSCNDKQRGRGRGRGGGQHHHKQYQHQNPPNMHGFYPQIPPWTQFQCMQCPQHLKPNMDGGAHKNRHHFFVPKHK